MARMDDTWPFGFPSATGPGAWEAAARSMPESMPATGTWMSPAAPAAEAPAPLVFVEPGEAAETRIAGALEQREPGGGIRGGDGRGAPRKRCGDRTLPPGLDLEQRQGELGPLVRERARRGRNPLSLGERLLERGEPFLRERRTAGDVVAGVGRGARSRGRFVRLRLELGR